MLTVSYFCFSNEIKYFKEHKIALPEFKGESSEFWHFKAVEISSLYLPGSCPIVKHYISTYSSHYSLLKETIVKKY
jgi:hypothetical protein